MKGSIMPKRFRSVRDKNGNHRWSKSSEPGLKSRPTSTEMLFSIFKTDSATKQAQKEKEEEGRETAKIDEISRRLIEEDLFRISREHIRDALDSKFASGDPDKAIELLHLQQEASAGIIRPYNPNIRMLGAENRGNVTCYLDSLLFAMFSRLDAFECMLKEAGGDENQRKLAALIRLWVNTLRAGRLIDTDMTQNIQEALARCGWADAELLEQQDTSEAFAFITETLQLPLLTLQVDLYHQGKGDKDDHKVVYERLLNLAVPPDPDGKGIKLEDCLEEYFNNRVDVLRDSHEEKQRMDSPLSSPRSTIRIVTAEDDSDADDRVVSSPVQLENSPLRRSFTMETPEPPASSSSRSPLALRHRSTSVIQRIVLDEEGRPEEAESTSLLQKAKRTRSTVVKAVTIPAWQFFRLIPWNATSSASAEPRSDVDVARHLNQRPVVGICLKRYTLTASGVPIRKNTFIDIPDSMRLPYFMMVDAMKANQGAYGLSAEYKLVLQSIVCHRGDSLHSGHYVAFARTAPKLLTDNRRYDLDPPPDYEEAQWVKFDDLALENRVSYVDDIKKSLREEMPYLLFYQIVPMVEVATSSGPGSVVEPPSYNESAVNITGPGPQSHTAFMGADPTDGLSRPSSGFFHSITTPTPSSGLGIRFSSDLERPTRHSMDEDFHPTGSPYRFGGAASRRGSVAASEPNLATPTISPDGQDSPAGALGEESTATRLSRAAAMFAKAGGKSSRPSSQAGEGRIGFSMSRIGGLMRTSREPLVDGPEAPSSSDQPQLSVAGSETDGAAGGEGNCSSHGHAHLKKDRGKSKNREERDRERGKGKWKENKAGLPERECIMM